MPIPSVITDLSATAALNSPSGSDSPIDGDNFLRALSAFIRQNYDTLTATIAAGLTAAQLASTSTAAPGASLVGFLQSGTGAVGRTTNAKERDIVSVKDFGAIGNGVADDTSAIQLAMDSLPSGGEVWFPAGSYKISASLTNAAHGLTLRGAGGSAIWNGISTIYTGGSWLIKSSAMTTEAIKNNGGLSFAVQDLAVYGEAGNTGDGIYLLDGQSTRILNVSIAGIGGNGIRIGAKSGASGNVNGWQMHSVTSQYNGGHGVIIHDETSVGGPNANAGTAIGLNVAGNTGDGLRLENGQFNTFVGLLSQENTAYGVSLIGTASLSLYVTITGGDIEGNTSGNWNIGADAKHIQIIAPSTAAPTTIDPSANFATVITGAKTLIRSLQFSTSAATIDSYDEQDFPVSPVIAIGATNQTGWTITQARYKRLNGTIFYRISMTKAVPVYSGTGAVTVKNLPIASLGGGCSHIAYFSSYTSSGYIGAYINGTTIELNKGNNRGTNVTETDLAAGAAILVIEGHYFS